MFVWALSDAALVAQLDRLPLLLTKGLNMQHELA
jgi:hypothetical protein